MIERGVQYLPEIATLLPLIGMAFSVLIRKQIGYRDHWECQWEDGCNLGKDGKPARFQDGFMVQAAHYDHDASSPDYNNPDNGRILCLAHHYLDELARGNIAVLPLIGSLDPYTVHVRKNKEKYPWLNGHKKVTDILQESQVGDWENDPEWTADDRDWVLAWMEVVYERASANGKNILGRPASYGAVQQEGLESVRTPKSRG